MRSIKSDKLAKFMIIALFIFPAPAFCRDKESEAVKDIQEDIKIINLLNNMELKKGQIEFMLQKAREASAVRKNASDKTSLFKSDMASVSEAIKEDVESGRVTVDKPDAEKFRKIKKEAEEINRDAYAQIDRIATEIESKLEEFQLLALDAYKPCIIPVMQNGRIGQSDKPVGIVRVLERAKNAGAFKYDKIKYKLADNILGKVKENTPPDMQINEAQIKQKILSAFEEVRKMDDVYFSLKKEAFAQELRDNIYPQKPAMSSKDKIKKFLLPENIIPILEKRI